MGKGYENYSTMFKNVFSFEGRIRRTEYGISLILLGILYNILAYFLGIAIYKGDGSLFILIPLYFVLLWLSLAQGAKRCHDLGKSGWWQLIPLYAVWLLFESGNDSGNKYGDPLK
jgi:uncharacterized membrane protein YhaH (DUF805 family)